MPDNKLEAVASVGRHYRYNFGLIQQSVARSELVDLAVGRPRSSNSPTTPCLGIPRHRDRDAAFTVASRLSNCSRLHSRWLPRADGRCTPLRCGARRSRPVHRSAACSEGPETAAPYAAASAAATAARRAAAATAGGSIAAGSRR